MSDQVEYIDTSSTPATNDPNPKSTEPVHAEPAGNPPRADGELSNAARPSSDTKQDVPPVSEESKEGEGNGGKTKQRKQRAPAKREAKVDVPKVVSQREEQIPREEKTKAISKPLYEQWLDHRRKSNTTISQIRTSIDQLARLSRGQRLGR